MGLKLIDLLCLWLLVDYLVILVEFLFVYKDMILKFVEYYCNGKVDGFLVIIIIDGYKCFIIYNDVYYFWW